MTMSRWTELLENAESFSKGALIVAQAMNEGSREEVLSFLADLYREFIAPDPVGGSAGTLEHMRQLTAFLRPTEEELRSVEVDISRLRAYLSHE